MMAAQHQDSNVPGCLSVVVVAARALRSCASFGAGPTNSGSTRAVRKGGHCSLHGNGRPYQSRLAARSDAGAAGSFLFPAALARWRP